MSKFMIQAKNGTYLRKDNNGNYVPVKRKELGEVWEQRNKATNILQNCIAKNLRGRYRVVEVADEVFVEQARTAEEEYFVKPKEEATKEIADSEITETKLDTFAEKLSEFSEFVVSTEERKQQLNRDLSDIDLEITDIHHYIEFGKFNAYQGWLAFNMLRNRLRQRRKIKDELFVLSQFSECTVDSSMIDKVKTTIGSLNARKYQPRKLTHLFE